MAVTVVVSSGIGRFHLYYAALAAARAGILRQFMTTVYFKYPEWLRANWITWLLGSKRAAKVQGRHMDGVPPDKVVPLVMPELVQKLIQRPLLKLLPSWQNCTDRAIYHLYGLYAARHLEACAIFHTRSAFSYRALERARQLGAITLVDQSHAHPRFVDAILTEEYEKWGVEQKHRTFTRVGREMEEDMEAGDSVLVNSEFARDTLVRHGIPLDKVRIVHTGVDTTRFNAKGWENQTDARFLVTFVGRICIAKGVPYLLEAFRQTKLKRAELMLVGAVQAEIEPILQRYSGLFRYVPRVPNQELPALYARSSVLVHPTLHEGSALVVSEAMACGVPVIVTRNAGSVARDGQDGYVISAQSIEALKESLLRLYSDVNLRKDMGKSAWRRVRSGFTWEDYMRNLVALYQEIANDNSDS